MKYDICLPFPRESTLGDVGLGEITFGDKTHRLTEGRLCVVPDTIHDTGLPVVLIALKNDTGSALTVARKFYKFSMTSAEDIFRRCGGVNDVAGGMVVAMNDLYPVGMEIPAGDIFWAVLSGPVKVATEASSVSLAAGNAIASDASGLINGAAAAAGEFVAATIPAAATETETETLILMAGNLAMPPAAG